MGLAPRGGIAQLPQSRGPSPQGGMPNPQAQGIPTPMQGGQKKPLVEVLAMQKLEREKQAAMRDMQAKMDTDPRSIAEQLEASVMSMTQDEVKGNVKGVMDKKNTDAQKNVQRASKGLPPARPAGLGALAGGARPQPRPQPTQGLAAARMAQGPTKMAGGGIVAFQEGKLVKLTPTQKAAARQKFGARADRFITTLESMPQEANTAKRMLQELGPVTEPQPQSNTGPFGLNPAMTKGEAILQSPLKVAEGLGGAADSLLSLPAELGQATVKAVGSAKDSFQDYIASPSQFAIEQGEAPSLGFESGTTPQEKQLQGLPSLSQRPTSALPLDTKPTVLPTEDDNQRPSEGTAQIPSDKTGISKLAIPDTDVLAGGIGSGDVKPKLDEIVNANTVDIAAADGDVSKVSGGRSKGTGTGGLGSLESYTAEARKLLGADKYQEKYAELTQRLKDLDDKNYSPEEMERDRWAAFFEGAAGKTSLGALGAGVSSSVRAERNRQKRATRQQLIDQINLDKEALALDSSLQQAAINVGFSLLAEDRATQTAATAAANRVEDQQLQAILKQAEMDQKAAERADTAEYRAATLAVQEANAATSAAQEARLREGQTFNQAKTNIDILTGQQTAALEAANNLISLRDAEIEKKEDELRNPLLTELEELIKSKATVEDPEQIAGFEQRINATKAALADPSLFDQAQLAGSAFMENYKVTIDGEVMDGNSAIVYYSEKSADLGEQVKSRTAALGGGAGDPLGGAGIASSKVVSK